MSKVYILCELTFWNRPTIEVDAIYLVYFNFKVAAVMEQIFLAILSKINELFDDIEFKIRSRTAPGYFSREGGKLGFKNTLLNLMNFNNKTQSIELDNFFKLTGLDRKVTKQAFSLARQKINPMALKEMYDVTLEDIPNCSELSTFNGYTTIGIDGSTAALDNMPELIEYFGCSGPKVNSCTARFSIACDTINGIVLDAAISKYATGERQLAKEHVENVIKLGISKPLFIFDRGYAGKKLLAQIDDAGQRYILRVRSRWMEKIVTETESGSWAEFTYNKKIYKTRVIKIVTDAGKNMILFSNVEEFCEDDFKEAYSLRWPVETKYDVIKNKLQLENFTGKTVISVLQDFWATMFLANLVAIAKLETDSQIEKSSKHTNKHKYQTNTNILIGKLKDNLVLMLLCDDPLEQSKIFEAITQRIMQIGKIPITRGVSKSRKNKRQKKKFNQCTKSAL